MDMEKLVSITISEILNSEMGKIAIPVAIFVIGVLLGYKWLKNAKTEEIKSQDEMYDKVENFLKKKFGDFSYHNTFTFEEAINWIEEQKLIDQGCKASIRKAESESLKLLWCELRVDVDKINFNKFGKFLIIRIYKGDDVKKSHVVKYINLTPRFEMELEPDGEFIYPADA